MGTITTRKLASGEVVYTAQIRMSERGKVVYSESKTFDRKALASKWMKRKESEFHESGATGIVKRNRITVGELIEHYIKQSEGITTWGRSKSADMQRLLGESIANVDARMIQASDIIDYCTTRRMRSGAGASTVLNDLVWLRQVFISAATHFSMTGPLSAVDAARAHLLRTRVVAKSQSRSRRLTPEEEQKLMDFFNSRDGRARIPMADIVQFALHTARRQEEICRLLWEDIDFEKGTAWLDDVKHPTMKMGNRREFRILEPALDIVRRQPKVAPEVFPYNSKSVGAAFTRTCSVLGIEDLHFHDLRHEATSRLFEKGYAIHEVALFTLHQSWAMLSRYTHLKPENIPAQ